MARTIVRLTVDLLNDFELPCRHCTYWEIGPASRGASTAEQAEMAKQAWVGEVLREWGSCGRVAVVDGRPVGYALYAPPSFVPGAAAFATAPVSADAVLLATMRVAPENLGAGLGRMLIQAAARDLIERGGIRAIEAFGTHATGGAGCVLPVDYLGAVGFKTHRPHPRHPRMRMDLRSTATWRSEMEAAIERLVGVVRPVPTPAPVPRQGMN